MDLWMMKILILNGVAFSVIGAAVCGALALAYALPAASEMPAALKYAAARADALPSLIPAAQAASSVSR